MPYQQGETRPFEAGGMTFHLRQSTRPRYEYLKALASAIERESSGENIPALVQLQDAECLCIHTVIESIEGYTDSKGQPIESFAEPMDVLELPGDVREALMDKIRGQDEEQRGNAPESSEKPSPSPADTP